MSDIGKVYIGRQAKSLNISQEFDGYSKVILNISDDLFYEAGTGTGRTMTLFCPWGTQAMCNNILASIRGYQYQPMEAQGTMLDPAAELGDGITVKDTYTILASTENTFGPMFTADVSAPHEEEIDHEYPYKSPQERKVERQFANTRASLKVNADLIAAEVEQRRNDIERVNAQLSVQAGQIAAKVSKSGGSASSFSWEMIDTQMVWKANNREIFRLDSSGAQVTGKITATSGKIGGFDILSDRLSFNNQTWGGTNSTGIYLGPSGLQMGKNFKVDSAGNLNANSGTFNGTVRAGSIVSDGVNGYGGSFNGSGISHGSISGSRLRANTVTTSYTSGGINASLGYADFANGVFGGWNKASYGKFNSIYIGNNKLGMSLIKYKDGNGVTQTGRFVTW